MENIEFSSFLLEQLERDLGVTWSQPKQLLFAALYSFQSSRHLISATKKNVVNELNELGDDIRKMAKQLAIKLNSLPLAEKNDLNFSLWNYLLADVRHKTHNDKGQPDSAFVDLYDTRTAVDILTWLGGGTSTSTKPKQGKYRSFIQQFCYTYTSSYLYSSGYFYPSKPASTDMDAVKLVIVNSIDLNKDLILKTAAYIICYELHGGGTDKDVDNMVRSLRNSFENIYLQARNGAIEAAIIG